MAVYDAIITHAIHRQGNIPYVMLVDVLNATGLSPGEVLPVANKFEEQGKISVIETINSFRFDVLLYSAKGGKED